MENYRRYALYFAPRPGAFRSAAETWLGREALEDRALTPPYLRGAGLAFEAARITQEPRRYGLHATLKAPFRLAEGQSPARLWQEVEAFGREAAPLELEGLALRRIGSFLALVPERDSRALSGFASRVVRHFDRFRAPLSPAEIARRAPEKLTPRQRALLTLWGYPYVMEEFRFHLTLTDRLEAPGLAEAVETALEGYFAPVLPRPLWIEDLCIFGETTEGRFRELHRVPLTG